MQRVNKTDINTAIRLFQKLNVRQGKASAGTLVNSLVRQFVRDQLADSKPSMLTSNERKYCRENRKLMAVKSVKLRLCKTLMDAKHYVELHGAKELADAKPFDNH